MVKLKKQIQRMQWVKGSILEPVVALVILLMAIAMAFSILTKLNHVPTLQAINKANEMISGELLLLYTEYDFLDKEEIDGGLILTKTVTKSDDNSTIKVEFSVRDLKKKELSRKVLVLSEFAIQKESDKRRTNN